jgi:hypothetical protein
MMAYGPNAGFATARITLQLPTRFMAAPAGRAAGPAGRRYTKSISAWL